MHLDVKPKRYKTLRASSAENHGPVKVLVENGRVLEKPHSIPANESTLKAKELRDKASQSELRMVERLRVLGFEHSVPMKGFYLDFYNRYLKICIEIDGPHHSTPEHRGKDRQRDAAMRAQGIRTWRFKANWARGNPAGLEQYVRKLLARLVPDIEEHLP
jgi:very-short-patch-repair endonuclease